jgi:hypothetical protein
VPLSGAATAAVTLKHGAGRLLVRRGAPEATLLEGTFGGGVEGTASLHGGRLDVDLRLPQRRGFMSFRYPWAWGPANALDWTVGLAPTVPVDLFIHCSGGQAELDLRGLAVRTVRIEASASTVLLRLAPAVGDMGVVVAASVSSFDIQVSRPHPLRIRSKRSLRGSDIDEAEFPPSLEDHEYASPGFSSATDRVDISLDVGWGSVQVTRLPDDSP